MENPDLGQTRRFQVITHIANPTDCQTTYDLLADHPKEALGMVFAWT